jgi:hypothetical protein
MLPPEPLLTPFACNNMALLLATVVIAPFIVVTLMLPPLKSPAPTAPAFALMLDIVIVPAAAAPVTFKLTVPPIPPLPVPKALTSIAPSVWLPAPVVATRSEPPAFNPLEIVLSVIVPVNRTLEAAARNTAIELVAVGAVAPDVFMLMAPVAPAPTAIPTGAAAEAARPVVVPIQTEPLCPLVDVAFRLFVKLENAALPNIAPVLSSSIVPPLPLPLLLAVMLTVPVVSVPKIAPVVAALPKVMVPPAPLFTPLACKVKALLLASVVIAPFIVLTLMAPPWKFPIPAAPALALMLDIAIAPAAAAPVTFKLTVPPMPPLPVFKALTLITPSV